MQRTGVTRSSGMVLTAAAAAVIGAIEGVQGYGVSLLTPEFAATFAVGAASLVSARVVGFLLGALLPLVFPAIPAVSRPQVRVWVARLSAVLCAVVLMWTGSGTSTAHLVLVLCVMAAVGAPVSALHRALVVDALTVNQRFRALSLVQLAVLLVEAALAGAAVADGLHATQHAFRVVGVVVLAVALLSSVLLRPVPPIADTDAERLTWKELLRGWRATPTLVGLAAEWFAIGVLTLPFFAVLSIYLRGHRDLSTHGIGVVFLIVALTSVVVVAINATWCERPPERTPGRLATEPWTWLATGSIFLATGLYLPSRAAMVVVVAVGSACVAAAAPMLSSIALAVVPPSQRPALCAALAGLLSLGAAGGAVYATAFEDRHGPRSALIAMAVVGLLAALIARSRIGSLAIDQARVRDAARDLEQRRATVAAGGPLPLLACQGINFSYGALQVLFDVDFTIGEGEVVALLGTNGAGKSTLLKVISGVELPQRGAIRLAGRDITYLDAQERVRIGVTQVPGGRAVFGPLNVVENLQTFGYTLGRDRRAVAAAIERCLDTFPQLASRRTADAATLSGGEQQLLGLCKALILRPRLLLIDELTLGLAPVVIAPLLDTVREINAAGAAVVIVEQSVSVALSLVEHAYFMEKGSIRFDGRAADLLDRQDLLRAVFLEGAARTALS